MRKKLIAGNWKMNKTILESVALCKDLRELIQAPQCDVVVCVPFTDLAIVKTVLANSVIEVGAQNVSWADKGAFTGEISALMLLESGVSHVIVGHSERRAMFGETDKTVFMRAKKALDTGLIPIVCVGETKEQREGGITEKILAEQVDACLSGFSAAEIGRLAVAYEPVWAIGTGLTASNEQAQAAIAFIRARINALSGAGDKVRILYGGSMNANNAAGLLAMPDIDGGLIGGASLTAADFSAIVGAAEMK